MIQKARSVFRRMSTLALVPFFASLTYQLSQKHENIPLLIPGVQLVLLIIAGLLTMNLAWSMVTDQSPKGAKLEVLTYVSWFACIVFLRFDFSVTLTTMLVALVVWGINLLDVLALIVMDVMTKRKTRLSVYCPRS